MLNKEYFKSEGLDKVKNIKVNYIQYTLEFNDIVKDCQKILAKLKCLQAVDILNKSLDALEVKHDF